MLLMNDAARNAVLRRFDLSDFEKGKKHLVQKLRNIVAEKVAGQDHEIKLSMLLNFCRQQQLGPWLDKWNPSEMLRERGFDFLLRMDGVEAVGANEDGAPTDILVRCSTERGDEIFIVSDGVDKLAALTADLKDVFSTPGETHWATQTDIAALAEHLDIGFIVFASEVMGNDRWIQGLNAERGDFVHWMMIYWIAPVHFQLAQLRRAREAQPRAVFHIDDVPEEIRAHYDLCNTSSAMGRAHYGGVS